MPEGAEVKIITDQLNVALAGHTLVSMEILGGRYQRHKPPVGFNELLPKLPLPIEAVNCKGKFIYFVITDIDPATKRRWSFIWNTLGMTGRWSKEPTEHSRIKFLTSAGEFFFEDVRNFGTIHMNRTLEQTDKKLDQLGLDLLADNPDLQVFKSRLLKRRKKTIVETLMDQSITAGVGNYVKCEGLYHAGISPHRITGSLVDDEFKGLLASLTHVLRSSYDAKGHTMSDYRDLEGDAGDFKFKLSVYNQEEDPKGNAVIKEATLDGRTTHWVPGVQR